MSSSYDARGRRVGVTMVKIEPNLVTQVKTTEGKDGYNSVQLGSGLKKSVRKPQLGHLKKAGIEKKLRWLKEVRTDETLEPGKEIVLNQVFSVGDQVKVTGVSKGRGFQGGVRRHGFAGGPKTHGQSDRHRAPGSIGSGTTPGRVYKGLRMAGHMGVDQVSIKGLEVVKVDRDNNLLVLKGGIPGPIGGLIRVENTGQIKGYTPPPEEKPEESEEELGDQNPESSNEGGEAQAVEETPATKEASAKPVETPEENANS